MINESDIKLLESALLKTAEEIRTIQSSTGLKASGRSAKELTVNMESSLGQVVDHTGSFEYQERGRGPGKVKVRAIYDWLEWKKYGMNWESDRQRRSLAYAIARKIARLGTKTHIDKRVTGVISTPINDQTLREFIATLAEKKSVEIRSDIIAGFKP